jgi:hypothetical protein
MTRALRLLAAVAALAIPAPAFAWGAMGHRMIGEAAIQALPADAPVFLRSPKAVIDAGELSREPDRSKASGKIHDSNRDPGHFVDLDDEGKILGGPPLSALPPTRADYETALRAAGTDSWKAGYLPYSIVDQWQQLTKDLALWRVLNYAAKHEKSPSRRAWFAADKARREALVLVTVGNLSHFVGDGSQPLHVTLHYNGWGEFPNPKGYTTARVHGPFEEAFVRANVTRAMVRSAMGPMTSCGCSIEQRTAAYLGVTGAQVEPFYQLEKAGGFKDADPRGVAFARVRLGAGATELRDQIEEAWKASATASVGWPAVKVEDVLAGKVDPYEALYGKD